MSCRLMGIVIILASIMVFYYGYSGLKTGSVYIAGRRLVSKEDSPIIYWSHVVIYISVSLLGGFFGIFPELLVQLIRH